MLVLSRKPNESVIIHDNIKITVLRVQGQQVTLGCEAPVELSVHREEIYNRIQQQKESAKNLRDPQK